MNIHKSIFAVIASLGFAMTGCAGDFEMVDTPDDDPGDSTGPDPTTGGGATDAKALFKSDVGGMIELQCGACHNIGGLAAPEFVVRGDLDQTYAFIISDPALVGNFDAAAPLVALPISHAVQWSDTDKQTVVDWLAAEKAARATTPGGGEPTEPTTSPAQISAQLKSEWSGCMNLAEWQTLQVAEKWANKGSTTGTCKACHDNGGEGAIYSENSTFVFNTVTTNEVYMLSYFKPQVLDPNDPNAEPKMVINYSRMEAVRTATPPHTNHGRFSMNADDQAVQALEAFYNATMQRKANNQCDPPRM